MKLNLENVLVVSNAASKDPKDVSSEIMSFASKFHDPYYALDMIWRAQREINTCKQKTPGVDFLGFVKLPDDNGVIILNSLNLSETETATISELVSIFGVNFLAGLRVIGSPIGYEKISSNKYKITIKESEGKLTEVYADSSISV